MPDPKPRRWFVPRYSLRTLLVVMTVVCLVSGFWLNKAFRQRDAVMRFKQLTSNRPVDHGDAMLPLLYRDEGQLSAAPIISERWQFLRDWIGEEAFGNLIIVQLTRTDATDEDLRYLQGVPTLEQLWLARTKVTDNGMRHLHACRRLQFLVLDNTAITDDGLKHISVLKELNSLSLSGTKVTDQGLEHLARLTELKELWLRGTAITDAGYRKLQAALPKCEIQADVPAYSEKYRQQHWRGFRTYQAERRQ